MKPIKYPTWVIVLFATFSLGFLLPAEAADKTCDPWLAKAVSVQGIVEARKAGQTLWVQVKLNDTFCPGDMIRVQENSRAAIALSNETNLSLDQKTTIKNVFAGFTFGCSAFFQSFSEKYKSTDTFCKCVCGRNGRFHKSQGR
jgi:hypothetical protein